MNKLFISIICAFYMISWQVNAGYFEDENFAHSEMFKTITALTKESFAQEGMDRIKLYDELNNQQQTDLNNALNRAKKKNLTNTIPHITNVVYLTNPQDPKPWKELFINKYLKTNERLNKIDPKMVHYIWTNHLESIPKEIQKTPNVRIKTFAEFGDYPLIKNLNSLIEKIKEDPSMYAQASDVARIIVLRSYGGIYHDLDYEIFDAKALLKHMSVSSFIAGKENNRFDSLMGNSFIAATPRHPVIEDIALRIKRNLNLEPGVPEYIKFPVNKFASIISSTGPLALTLSYFKVKESGSKLHLPMLVLQPNVLHNVEYARQEIQRHRINPVPKGTIGGDLLNGDWCTSNYLEPINYSDKHNSIAK